ncbi:Hpt domain-containing protein [Microbacteriaceae bacterium K1510]|nr:Hpt domain-containing protein [Microbacteriaceae bacterium K1510]
MAPRKNTAAIATYGDHEVIVPENKLRGAILAKAAEEGTEQDDPVARAEQALADLSGQFGTWMDTECERLDKARQGISGAGFTKTTKELLFHAAHDIKGQAATFGYPAVASAADSLCRLIEFTPNSQRIPLKLVDQHVDAVRAIYREYARSDAVELARLLTRRLRDVTDEFLLRENHDRPDILEQIRAPSLVPE